jgi:hypothetical protein
MKHAMRLWDILLTTAAALPLVAAGTPFDLLTATASSLSDGNVVAFLDGFSQQMPGYEHLRMNVQGLTDQATALSSVEVLRDDGDSSTRRLEVDWVLEIRSKAETGSVERRRRTLRIGMNREKNRWKIVELDALEFFGPPHLE